MDAPTLDRFPLHTTDRLRYGDTDRQGHVNNAVHATLFESNRVALLYDPARGLPPEGCEFVLARIEIDYLAELTWPGDVTVGGVVARIGRSSVTFEQALFKDGAVAARAVSVGVLMDGATRRATPLPDAARAALSRFTEKGGSDGG